MKKTTEPQPVKSIFNKAVNDYQLNDFDERNIKEILNLDSETHVCQNANANELKWYGKRLTLLLNFYNKNRLELCLYLGYNRTYFSKWERSELVPTEKVIKKLALLFEVPENFFTDKDIKIKINEQLKLEMI